MAGPEQVSHRVTVSGHRPRAGRAKDLTEALWWGREELRQISLEDKEVEKAPWGKYYVEKCQILWVCWDVSFLGGKWVQCVWGVVTSERRLKGEERVCELATLHGRNINNHLSRNYLPTQILWHCWILEKRFVWDAVCGLGSWWLLLEWYICTSVTTSRNCLEVESH